MKTLWFLRKNFLLRLTGFVVFAFFLSLFPYPNLYFRIIPKTQGINVVPNEKLPPPPPVPVNINNIPPPNISAKGVYIIDIPSNIVLYQKKELEKFSPASTTKIMTALVSMDHFRLDDILTVNTVITEGRTMGLVGGEKITFESLLYGMLIHSANDAAYTIAENYPQGVDAFVSAMNKKAIDLHLENTRFINPIGFDNENQYTTGQDLAKQALVAMNNKSFAKIVGTRSITVSDVDYTYFHPLSNVNELLGSIPGVNGVKTGFTEIARGVLISEVKKQDKNVLFIVLASYDRFGESAALIKWLFANFTWMPLEEIIPTNQR